MAHSSLPPSPGAQSPRLPLADQIAELRNYQNLLRQAAETGRVTENDYVRLRVIGSRALSGALGANDPRINEILAANQDTTPRFRAGPVGPADLHRSRARAAGLQANLVEVLIGDLEREFEALSHAPSHESVAAVQQASEGLPIKDPKRVFIIHGRNDEALAAMETFLRSLGLRPWSFNDVSIAAGPNATILDVVKKGVTEAQAVIALCTPDEFSVLHPTLRAGGEQSVATEPTGRVRRWQPRPNVLVEVGLALAANPGTIIVTLGSVDLGSDLDAIHKVRMDNNIESRKFLKGKLLSAECPIDESGSETPRGGGDFEACVSLDLTVGDPFSDARRERGP